MNLTPATLLTIREKPTLEQGTLVLAFSGWMDGGDVSTGTVSRLVHLLEAQPFAEIDPEPFYIYNFPGSMEIAALFRPNVEIEDGLIKSCDLPRNEFSVYSAGNLALFVGKEPNLRWRTFGDCIFELVHQLGVTRILFVGSFGGSVPHTRDPRLYVTCSHAKLLPEMEQYATRRSGYEGPGSFTSYLMTRAETEGVDMVSLAVEIPAYLQGTNLLSIEAVTRRLARMLKLKIDLNSLRVASAEWELQISSAIDENQELAKTVRALEKAYDDELIGLESDDGDESDESDEDEERESP